VTFRYLAVVVTFACPRNALTTEAANLVIAFFAWRADPAEDGETR
jgi:hypothetical protein